MADRIAAGTTVSVAQVLESLPEFSVVASVTHADEIYCADHVGRRTSPSVVWWMTGEDYACSSAEVLNNSGPVIVLRIGT